ncbi:hypothetical protein [Desulfonatronum thiosulfatophilum]|uniref:hypothetical protein n=1 Tax=Desulfonatronum thiosulfatophilum TaxID=617002 RepID=UPI001FC933B1|nr:hypothetical protein [Desulfonatronum thiosulfatophilum]
MYVQLDFFLKSTRMSALRPGTAARKFRPPAVKPSGPNQDDPHVPLRAEPKTRAKATLIKEDAT